MREVIKKLMKLYEPPLIAYVKSRPAAPLRDGFLFLFKKFEGIEGPEMHTLQFGASKKAK